MPAFVVPGCGPPHIAQPEARGIPQWRNIGENFTSGVTGNCLAVLAAGGRPHSGTVSERKLVAKRKGKCAAGPFKTHIRTQGGSLSTLQGHACLASFDPSDGLGAVFAPMLSVCTNAAAIEVH